MAARIIDVLMAMQLARIVLWQVVRRLNTEWMSGTASFNFLLDKKNLILKLEILIFKFMYYMNHKPT